MSPLGKLFPEENIKSPDHVGVGVKIAVSTVLVKFIRNYIRDLSTVFSISSVVRISMTSFPLIFFVCVRFANGER